MKSQPFRNKCRVPVLLAAALLGLSSVAHARDYYVDAREGSDTNEGSEQHPFRTLAPLLARLTPCDNAYVKIDGAANGNGVGRYSHAELPTSSICTSATRKG